MADVCVASHKPAAFGGIDVPSFAYRPFYDRPFGSGLPQRSHVKTFLGSGFEGGMFGFTTTTSSPKTSSHQWYRESIAETAGLISPENDHSSGFVTNQITDEIDNEQHQSADDATSKSGSSPQYVAELESLISRMDQNVVIRDVAVQNPLWLYVPKGYVMEQAMSPTAFYRTRHEVRTHVNKRKRALGPLPKKPQRDSLEVRHGFRPQEVNGNGAVHLEDCRPSNLANAIHPLFERSAFDDTPDAIYDQLIPGLQLATMFLTQPICMQFWVTLAIGQRRDDAEMSAYNGKPCQRIDSHVELTQRRAFAMIERIEKLGKSKLIHFRFKHRLSATQCPEGVWGVSDPICDYKGLQKEFHGQQGPLIRSIIRLHADYYIVAKKLSQLKYPEVSQQLRFNFQFAVLIMHELTHSIEGIHIRDRGNQWIDWQASRFYREPYWLDWQHAEHASELGRAWEETMFGGEIAPINDRIDGSHGIGTSDWPPRGSYEDPERRIWFTVSMEYIEGMFQMDTWRRNFDLKQWRVFNIPRDGAISLYINSFTTMSWDEEQRVASEAIAELVNLENEQPAKKKRITNEGETEEHRLEDEAVIEQAIEEQQQQLSGGREKQVPMFPTPRRLSSKMLGALSDREERVVLSPQTRKRSTSSKAAAEAYMVPSLPGSGSPRSGQLAGKAASSFNVRQRKSLDDQHLKDNERPTYEEPAKPRMMLGYSLVMEPTSKLIKNIKSRPKGLMDRYRLKKRSELWKKQAEAKREQRASNRETMGIK